MPSELAEFLHTLEVFNYLQAPSQFAGICKRYVMGSNTTAIDLDLGAKFCNRSSGHSSTSADFHPKPICAAWESVTDRSARDWLYGVSTVRCGCGEQDNNPWTLASRIFLPVLYVSATAVILIGSSRKVAPLHSESDSEDSGCELVQTPPAKPPERLWHLDYARIVCVACVITEHCGGSHYSDRNIMWVQQWVLPWLYTISGISVMLSRSTLVQYELRLLVVFIFGTGANWIADIVSGRDWRRYPINTVFQMAYITVLAVLGFFLHPLKEALQWRSEHPAAPSTMRMKANALFWGIMSSVVFTYFMFNWPLLESAEALSAPGDVLNSGIASIVYHAPVFFSKCFGTAFLASLACVVGYSEWTAWVLIFVIFAAYVGIPFAKGGHPINSDLYIVGMVSQQWSMKGKAAVARFMREQWPIWLCILLLLSTPEVTGRCDLQPLNTLWERFRFRTIEVVLLVALLSGALNTSDSLGITRWLTVWALAAYCLHVAFARVLPAPYGAVVTYGMVPLFWLRDWQLQRRKAQKKSYEESEGN